jgi:hypothetical protein
MVEGFWTSISWKTCTLGVSRDNFFSTHVFCLCLASSDGSSAIKHYFRHIKSCQKGNMLSILVTNTGLRSVSSVFSIFHFVKIDVLCHNSPTIDINVQDVHVCIESWTCWHLFSNLVILVSYCCVSWRVYFKSQRPHDWCSHFYHPHSNSNFRAFTHSKPLHFLLSLFPNSCQPSPCSSKVC